MRTKHYFLLSTLLFLVVMIGTGVLFLQDRQFIVINEIRYRSGQTDWIELYNSGIRSESLRGYRLADNPTEQHAYIIEDDIVIPPGGFALLYGKQDDGDEHALQLPFGIKEGEQIYLMNARGAVVDQMTTLPLGEDDTSETIGVFPDGSDDLFLFSHATPGLPNQKDQGI
jgi:hypothetical protein